MTINEQINSYKRECLSFEEEAKLIRTIQDRGAGRRRAMDILIKANLYYSGEYARKFQFSKVQIEDLWSSANEGLMESIDSYDASLGVPFHKYAEFRMKRCILSNIEKNGYEYANLPAKIISDLKKLSNVENVLSQKHKGEPTTDEIADEMNITEDEVLYLLNLRVRFANIDTIISVNSDDNIDTNMESGIIETEDEAIAIENHTPKNTVSFKEILPPFDYEVFVRSKGLDGYEPMTHAEILEDINRIRKKEGKKLKTLEDVQIHYNRAILLDKHYD